MLMMDTTRNRLSGKWLLLLLLPLLASISTTLSYKILLLPLSQKSHVFCLTAIAKELAQRGHQPYILLDGTSSIDLQLDNVTIVRYKRTGVFTATDDAIEKSAQLLITTKATFSDILKNTTYWMQFIAKDLLLGNEPLVNDLKSAGFDIAIVDGTFWTKYLYLLVHRLGIPWITYTDYPDAWKMRVPWLPSFVPGKFSSQSDKMDLVGRIWNLVISFIVTWKEDSITLPDDIMAEYQKYGEFDSVEDLMERSKFWLITTDPLLDFLHPTMPHMAEVGGLTTEEGKQLPENIQRFLDGADDGAIFVSFGTMLSAFPAELLKKFLEAFRGIERHRIVWRLQKMSDEYQIPEYIKTGKWLPQNDILAHPKMRLFITHCGNNGQFEALYHGVPMIGFPFLGDQHYNAIRIEDKGYGIAMDLNAFTSDELHSNIVKILNDPSYKHRISVASEIFRSAPQRPTEKAAYWTEHVIRFGSDHLVSTGRSLNFFQYYMLDVLAVVVVLATSVVKVLCWLLKTCLGLSTAPKIKKD